MTKRSLLLIILYCAVALPAIGQNGFWNCTNPKNTNLICLLPVATRATTGISGLTATINSAFATQLTQLPVLSSGAAIVVTGTDPATGLPIYSDDLGSILTDRADTVGKHKLLLAFGYQHFSFNSIDGNNLNALSFVLPSTISNGLTQQTHELVNVGLTLNQYVGVATFGLTKKLDVSLIVPINSVSIGSSPVATTYYVTPQNQVPSAPFNNPGTVNLGSFHGSSNGIGDILVNFKGVVYSGESNTIAAGMIFRFPTGDAVNYLGSGAYGFNPYAVWSHPFHKVSPHVRLGYQFNTSTILIPSDPINGTGSSTLPGGFQYALGADVILLSGKRPVTFAGDLIGNYVVNAPVLVSKYTCICAPAPPPPQPPYTVSPFPYPSTVQALNPGLAVNQANPITSSNIINSYNSDQLALGLKFRPWKNLILYGNVTFQLNDVGLRSSPVPLGGVSYTFKP
jgi:hypothetical protein